MKRSFIVIMTTLCFLITGCATGQKLTFLEGMPADAPVQKVQLKGEDCNWVPDLIRVEKDAHVILEVTSIDWDYNFNLKGYDLSFIIPEGQVITAEFFASKPGEFEFGCYIEKGQNWYWGGMVGKLIVE